MASNPDEVAWLLLKDTSDDGALRRFIAQYPNSPLRQDAEAAIAGIAAAQAAKSALQTPEQIAWNIVKDSKDPDQLQRFINQFPDSAERADAEQRVATLSAATAKSLVAEPTDRREVARALQMELKRVGCFDGTVDGEFSDATRAALRNFAKLASVSVPNDDVSLDSLKAVRGVEKRVCPLACGAHEVEKNGRCIADVPAPHKPESATRKIAADAVATEPPPHTLHIGQTVLVDDGSCPKGQIKKIIGGNGTRSRSCVSR